MISLFSQTWTFFCSTDHKDCSSATAAARGLSTGVSVKELLSFANHFKMHTRLSQKMIHTPYHKRKIRHKTLFSVLFSQFFAYLPLKKDTLYFYMSRKTLVCQWSNSLSHFITLLLDQLIKIAMKQMFTHNILWRSHTASAINYSLTTTQLACAFDELVDRKRPPPHYFLDARRG